MILILKLMVLLHHIIILLLVTFTCFASISAQRPQDDVKLGRAVEQELLRRTMLERFLGEAWLRRYKGNTLSDVKV